jgi:hypothetical protein
MRTYSSIILQLAISFSAVFVPFMYVEHFLISSIHDALPLYIHVQTFIIIIGIQPLGRSGHRPELSQATGMALVRFIPGKF